MKSKGASDEKNYRNPPAGLTSLSGGGYYGNTSGYVPLVTLPNTKLGIFLPLVTYYMAVNGYKAASHGVVPDHAVKYTIEELLAGKDKEMEIALKLARR